jgi:ketosteroid isomerase-like protein
MIESRSPREVVANLLAGIAAGPDAALAELYAPDAVVDIVYARPGGLRLEGRDALSRHFARVAGAPLRLTPERVVFYDTVDPELAIVEYDYRGEGTKTGRTFVAPNLLVVRVKNGLIVESHDYHDHRAIAAALEE